MELKSCLSALVTGGASRIGRALCIALAQKGIFVTVVDYSAERGEEDASLSRNEILKFHSGLKFPPAIFVKCDVSSKGEVAAAFEKHLEIYGGFDICINCAGITTFVPFFKDQTDGEKSWRHAINVNLVAVIDCIHRATDDRSLHLVGNHEMQVFRKKICIKKEMNWVEEYVSSKNPKRMGNKK